MPLVKNTFSISIVAAAGFLLTSIFLTNYYFIDLLSLLKITKIYQIELRGQYDGGRLLELANKAGYNAAAGNENTTFSLRLERNGQYIGYLDMRGPIGELDHWHLYITTFNTPPDFTNHRARQYLRSIFESLQLEERANVGTDVLHTRYTAPNTLAPTFF